MPLKTRTQASLVLAAYVTAVIFVLNLLLKSINYTMPSQLFGISVPLTTGVTTTISAKILNFVNGIVAFDITQILLLYVSAAVIIFVGALVMDNLPLPKGKTNWQRIALILLYGTLVFYVLIVGLVMQAWMVWIGLAVWYGVVALAVSLVQKYIRI